VPSRTKPAVAIVGQHRQRVAANVGADDIDETISIDIRNGDTNRIEPNLNGGVGGKVAQAVVSEKAVSVDCRSRRPAPKPVSQTKIKPKFAQTKPGYPVALTSTGTTMSRPFNVRGCHRKGCHAVEGKDYRSGPRRDTRRQEKRTKRPARMRSGFSWFLLKTTWVQAYRHAGTDGNGIDAKFRRIIA
jgi:hypothetical protein